MARDSKKPKLTPAEISHHADMCLAFQYGQDYVTDKNPAKVKLDFCKRFGTNAEAEAEFDKGTRVETAKQKVMSKK